jgi:putative membrane protein
MEPTNGTHISPCSACPAPISAQLDRLMRKAVRHGMIAILKFIHIVAISIWSAGLVSLPGLYVQRAHVKDDEALFRLQMMVRFAYVAIISPSAFVAVASGIMLIFGQQTFAGWFSVKLFFVVCLVFIHVLTGLVIIRLFREGQIYPVWRFVFTTFVTCVVVLAVLFTVLAKPRINSDLMSGIFQPGGLRDLAQSISPWPIP